MDTVSVCVELVYKMMDDDNSLIMVTQLIIAPDRTPGAIYTEVIRGNYGNASAYATILTLTSVLSLLIFYKVTGKRDVSV